MYLGNSGKGIAVRDSASGDGWLMWSSQNVFSRFIPSPFPGNAQHLVAVTYQNSQWFYENNFILTPFTPAPDDCIIAEIDFTNDTTDSLQGFSTNIHGIDTGYTIGDLLVTPNLWNGSSNNSEFEIEADTALVK